MYHEQRVDVDCFEVVDLRLKYECLCGGEDNEYATYVITYLLTAEGKE